MTLQLSEAWIALLAAFVPFLSALATKADSSDKLRNMLAVVAAAALAVVNGIVSGQSDVAQLAGAFVTAFVVSLASYYGVARHLNVNAKLLPRFGL